MLLVLIIAKWHSWEAVPTSFYRLVFVLWKVAATEEKLSRSYPFLFLSIPCFPAHSFVSSFFPFPTESSHLFIHTVAFQGHKSFSIIQGGGISCLLYLPVLLFPSLFVCLFLCAPVFLFLLMSHSSVCLDFHLHLLLHLPLSSSVNRPWWRNDGTYVDNCSFSSGFNIWTCIHTSIYNCGCISSWTFSIH